MMPASKWMPTRKWFAATILAAGTVATAIAQSGFSETTMVAIIGLVVQRAAAYLVPNA
jgi:hypothetical protein